MANIVQAVITGPGIASPGYKLPLQFSYKPPVPIKRTTVKQTAGDVAIFEALPVVGDMLIPWTIEDACKATYDSLLAIYNRKDTVSNWLSATFTFTGYWGDVFDFLFHTFDPPEVHSRLFRLSGSFRVVAVTSYSDAAMTD